MVDATTLEAPGSPQDPARRRRWRGWAGLGAVLVIVLAGTAYLISTQTYRLETGPYSGVYPIRDVVSVATFSGYREYQFPLRPGALVTFTFSIRNPGALPVRIDEVRDDGAFTIDHVLMNDPAAPESPLFLATTRPLQPVTLDSGAVLVLEVTIRVLHQYEPCSGFSFHSMPVRFTVLGRSREQSLPLGFVVAIVAPDDDGQVCSLPQFTGPA
jgi:hypothetical protein